MGGAFCFVRGRPAQCLPSDGVDRSRGDRRADRVHHFCSLKSGPTDWTGRGVRGSRAEETTESTAASGCVFWQDGWWRCPGRDAAQCSSPAATPAPCRRGLARSPGPTQARGCPWPRPGAAPTALCLFIWLWRREDPGHPAWGRGWSLCFGVRGRPAGLMRGARRVLAPGCRRECGAPTQAPSPARGCSEDENRPWPAAAVQSALAAAPSSCGTSMICWHDLASQPFASCVQWWGICTGLCS